MKIIECRWCSDEKTGIFQDIKECKNSAIEWIEFFKHENNYNENNYNEDIKKIRMVSNLKELNKIVFDYQFYYKQSGGNKK